MTTSEVLDDLRSRLLARHALLFLKTWEEDRWEDALAALALELERGLVVWTATRGAQPPLSGDSDTTDPLAFLASIEKYPPDHLFLLKDFHPYVSDPRIIRSLRDLVPGLTEQRKALLFLSPTIARPVELDREALEIELPLPGMEELRDELAAVLDQMQAGSGTEFAVESEQEERLLKAVLGLTSREARKALNRALLGRDRIDDDVYAQLVSEKRYMVRGSDLLEFYDLDEGVQDVGGLEGLKDWLAQRVEAFSLKAREQGIPAPKGALLLGVQGCGKSLTSRATARLLGFPLIRLDASNLLSSDRGTSEKNMRDVLHLVETIAPAVLWLDEVEKGFAGSDAEAGQDATMARLMGKFLTWMEERRAPVFVIATANSVTNLPPEMLRRGRFDELFFIDLPNYDERKAIYRIHLAKRGWKPELYDVAELASKSEGFSGAEIEQIVISAMVTAFGRGGILSQEHLEQAREQTVPLSVTMEERIFELREWARPRCRAATVDSRVMQMLEEEQRYAGPEDEVPDDAPKPEWVALAEHGQLNAALAEYVRKHDFVTFPQLQEAFASFLSTEGEQGLALRSDPNIVLWVGMSGEFAELLSKLIAGKRLYLHAANADRYAGKTNGLKLPRLDELPEDRVSKPAWLPTCFRQLPQEGGTGRFARVARIKLARS